jgi:hypothetical protein
MKNYNLLPLFVLSILLCSCSFLKNDDNCDETFHPIYVGLKNNIYSSIDSLILKNKSNEIVYKKKDTVTVNDNITFCDYSCSMSGNCKAKYSFYTSYLNYNTKDNSKQISIANNYFISYDGGDIHYDQYTFRINYNEFILPSYWDNNQNKLSNMEILDSYYINNRLERNVIKLYSNKSMLFISSSNKILQYVNPVTFDTLTAE